MDDFLRGYLECAFWLSAGLDETGDTSLDDAGFTFDDIAPSALADAAEDCAQFRETNASDLARYEELSLRDEASAGHDFWLSRNGHGAGFFDRGDDPVFDRLQDAARSWGESNVYVGDDGKVYFE